MWNLLQRVRGRIVGVGQVLEGLRQSHRATRAACPHPLGYLEQAVAVGLADGQPDRPVQVHGDARARARLLRILVATECRVATIDQVDVRYHTPGGRWRRYQHVRLRPVPHEIAVDAVEPLIRRALTGHELRRAADLQKFGGRGRRIPEPHHLKQACAWHGVGVKTVDIDGIEHLRDLGPTRSGREQQHYRHERGRKTGTLRHQPMSRTL